MPSDPSGVANAFTSPLSPAFAAEYAGAPYPPIALMELTKVMERSPVERRNNGTVCRIVTKAMCKLLATTREKISRLSVAGSAWPSSSASPPPAIAITWCGVGRSAMLANALSVAPSSSRSTISSRINCLAVASGNRTTSTATTRPLRPDTRDTVSRPIDPYAPVTTTTGLSAASNSDTRTPLSQGLAAHLAHRDNCCQCASVLKTPTLAFRILA